MGVKSENTTLIAKSTEVTIEVFNTLKNFKPNYSSHIESWHTFMPFAFNLMKVFKPNVFVELGTHYGDSYFTFCQARETYNLDTKCFAIDHWKGDVHSALYGDEVFDRVYEHNKKFYSEFSELIRSDFSSAIDNFKDGSIDLLHIDGFHTFEAVENDFRSWLPK